MRGGRDKTCSHGKRLLIKWVEGWKGCASGDEDYFEKDPNGIRACMGEDVMPSGRACQLATMHGGALLSQLTRAERAR